MSVKWRNDPGNRLPLNNTNFFHFLLKCSYYRVENWWSLFSLEVLSWKVLKVGQDISSGGLELKTESARLQFLACGRIFGRRGTIEIRVLSQACLLLRFSRTIDRSFLSFLFVSSNGTFRFSNTGSWNGSFSEGITGEDKETTASGKLHIVYQLPCLIDVCIWASFSATS